MPSIATRLDELIASVDMIMKKLSKMEWEKISSLIISALDSLKRTTRTLDFTSIKRAMNSISDV
jgi:hypothetical protein